MMMTEAAMSETSAPRLDYAPPLAWHKVRRWRRRFVVAGLVLSTVGFLYWAPPLWRHARLLYFQRQCVAYAAAPTRIVFEPDPRQVTALATDDGWVFAGASSPVHSPAEWRGFSRALQPGWAVGEPVIGLLDRTAPRGQSWLIAITLSTTGQPALRARLCTRA